MKVSISAEGIILGEFNLDRDVMRVGRADDAEIHIDHPTVSRRHAEIHRVRDGVFTLTALSQTNETVINGLEMTWEETLELDPGDLIVLSDTVHMRVAEGCVPQEDDDFEVGDLDPFKDPVEVDEDAGTAVMTPADAPAGGDDDLGDTTVLGPGQQVLHELDVVRAELAASLRTDQGVQEATRKAEAALAEARQKLAKAQSVTESLRVKQRTLQRELKGTQSRLLAQGRQNQSLRAEVRRAEAQRGPQTRRVARTAKPGTRPKKGPPRTPPPTTEKMRRQRKPPPTTEKMPRRGPPRPPRQPGAPRRKPRPPSDPGTA